MLRKQVSFLIGYKIYTRVVYSLKPVKSLKLHQPKFRELKQQQPQLRLEFLCQQPRL